MVRRLQITRLGEGVDGRRRLLPLPIARARNCLTEYRREIDRLGAERTLAVATSAVRDAENGEAFLGEVEWSYGFTTRLLSGDEEAQLMFRGVTAGRSVDPRTVVVDIGGGSTELVVGGPDGLTSHVSLELGCVRLTERFGDDRAALAAHVRSVLPDLDVSHAIGVAGTVTSLAALDLGLVDYDPERIHGHALSRQAIEEQLERLAELSLDERRNVPGLEPERAPVIVAGAVILDEIVGATGWMRSRLPSTTSSTAPRSRPRSCRSRSREPRRPAPTAAAEIDAARAVHLEHRSYADPNVTVELARAGEAAGWEALILWDHLGFVWGHPAADPWTVLAAVGASTSRLILGTSVTPLPRRRPHVLAHQLATLDGLTGGGRVVFGAGVGGLPREFAAFGEPRMRDCAPRSSTRGSACCASSCRDSP